MTTETATSKQPIAGIDPATRTVLLQSLHEWYDINKRDLPWRRTNDPYAIWISEAMLQQTQVKTVISYYLRFLERFPDAIALASAERESVYKLWEGLGYYSRARHLHQAAGMLVTEMEGKFPSDPVLIRRLPGIGEYIAAAVLSIAFGLPFAVVDGNVKRVLSRMFRISDPINQGKSHLAFQYYADLLLDQSNPARHNQAVMELGALVCTPRQPRCTQCPMAWFCQAFHNSETEKYPCRVKRPPLPQQRWATGVVIKNGSILLTKRPANGLLGGLWEFPCIPVANGDDAIRAVIEGIGRIVGLQVEAPSHLTAVRHAYTHFKLHMDVYLCRFRHGRVRLDGPAEFKWVRPSQIKNLPLHKAMHKAMPAIERMLQNESL